MSANFTLRALRSVACLSFMLTGRADAETPLPDASGSTFLDKEVTGALVRERLPEAFQQRLSQFGSGTSQFEWTLSWTIGVDDGLVERHVTRTAGDAVWQSNLGDRDGYHRTAYDFGRRPIDKELLAGTRNTLLHGGYTWYLQHAERPFTGTILPHDQPQRELPVEFAAGGMIVSWEHAGFNVLGLPLWHLEGFETIDYTTLSQGRDEMIVGEYGGNRLIWFLDGDNHGEPIRAEFHQNDRLVLWSETTWKTQNGRRIPANMQFYQDGDLMHQIDVQSATFDEPWHMQEITPDDIGVLYGTQLTSWHGRPLRWDGFRLLSGEEYDELLYIYGVLPDERVLEHLGRLINMSTEQYIARLRETSELVRDEYYRRHGEAPWLSVVKAKEKDEWDIFVEKYVAEHKFDKPRVVRAEELLKRAKQLRDYHRRRNIADIRRAEREDDQRKLEHFEKLTQRIFDTVLLRGLEALKPPQATSSTEKDTPVDQNASAAKGSDSPADKP